MAGYLCFMSSNTATIGIITSIGASLCCITPLLALLSGASGVASTFSWLEPARPYLIGLSVVCLSFAWYQKLRTPKIDDCGCATPEKRHFVQSIGFLFFVTISAVLLMTFPSYSHVFYKPHNPVAVASSLSNVSFKQVEFRVVGMGCASCEPEVETIVRKLSGVRSVKASCVKKNTVVLFDSMQTSTATIREAIKSTGYTVQYQIR